MNHSAAPTSRRWCARIAGSMSIAMLSPWAAAADAPLARDLAAACAGCHGTNGHARGEMPSLAGESANAMLATLAAFRSGERPGSVMPQIVKGYSDGQLRLIADWFATQPGAR